MSQIKDENLSSKNKDELIYICKEKGIKGYSGKKKDEILQMILSSKNLPIAEDKISRLNYIGSKFQLLEWITDVIKRVTKSDTFENKIIADLFAGTGVVSHHFRKNGAIVISNDAELYSSIISHAFTLSVYNNQIKNVLELLNEELNQDKYKDSVGFVTLNYSPYNENERKFFTIDNAQRIDYLRLRIEQLKTKLTLDEYKYILASLIISSDSVSNVPAVYGCYLKKFKSKAERPLILKQIHTFTGKFKKGSSSFNTDVLDNNFLSSLKTDIVYLDPPYNERQYSKNYFPLNIIAKTPEQLQKEPQLRGKTGIPTDCFISSFCKKEGVVEESFETLIKKLNTKYVFISYNSESIVDKEKMIEILKKYGDVSVEERDYKRFKSFEYNNDVDIKEYLFCLKKN